MTHDAEFSRLEQFVEKLVAGYNGLKAECAELQVQLQQLRQEKDELTEKLAGLSQERQDVHSRVSDLIGRIEEWEKGVKTEGDQDTAASGARRGSAAGEQVSMFDTTELPGSETPS